MQLWFGHLPAYEKVFMGKRIRSKPPNHNCMIN